MEEDGPLPLCEPSATSTVKERAVFRQANGAEAGSAWEAIFA